MSKLASLAFYELFPSLCSGSAQLIYRLVLPMQVLIIEAGLEAAAELVAGLLSCSSRCNYC